MPATPDAPRRSPITSEHDDVVRASFRGQVEAFSGPDSVYARREGPLAWIEPLDASFVVLDVACGAAHAAESVAPAVHQVVGIDLTPELLHVGAARLRANGVPNVLLQEGDAERLPFVPASFDVVFCRSSLHHFADPAGAVAEMAGVTRPGGRVVLVDLVAPADADRDIYDRVHRLLDPSHVRTFSEDELRAVLPAAAAATVTFVDSSVLRFPVEVAMSDQSDHEGVLSRLRAELAGGVATGLRPVEEDGTITVAFPIMVVHARVPAGS